MLEYRGKKLPLVLAAILIALVVAIAIVLSVVDGIATRKAQEQAALYSEKLGRKIEIGSISTTFFTGLGAKVSGLSVGPGKGEQEELLKLAHAQVKVAALKAIFSLGKHIEVRSVGLDGLDVNVVLYPDGTTNLERLQQRLAQIQGPPSKPEEKPKAASDLSAVRIDHAALNDARIAFVDRSGKGAKTLAVKDIDLVVNDLRVGAPLEVALKAAVLAEKQNLELHLFAAPLAKTLVPTPDRLTLKVQPAIDLAPLGPFLPRSVGLEGGTLEADFDAALGALVPGGEGPTHMKGAVRALALRFAGAQAGKPLDIVLDTDLKADAAKGEVQLDKLRLDIGPAGLEGGGRADGLNGGSPRVAGLRITSHDLDPEKLAAYYPPLAKSLQGQVRGPIGVSLQAAGTAGAQELELKIDLTPVKLAIPESLSKAAGAAMALTARLQGASGGAAKFQVKADLSGVDLRQGGSIDKAPGDRLELVLSGLRKVSGMKQHLEVPEIALQLKGDSIAGKATADLDAERKTTSFDLDLHSARLDLDKLLLETSKKKEKPPPDPKAFEGLSGRAQVKIDQVLYKKQTMKNAVVVAKIEEDKLTLEQAGLEAFSGSLSAAGTTLYLANPKAPFHALAQLRGLDMSQATAIATAGKVLAGKLDATIDVRGAGQLAEEVKKSLAGNLSGHLLDGVFFGKDLVASVTGPLSKALPLGLAGKTTQGGQTNLGKDLPVSITFVNGEAKLGKPLQLSTSEADVTLTGAVSLDGKLDMPGTILLSPATVTQLSGGKASVSQPVPVKLRLVGPATSPTVVDLDLREAVAALAKGAATGALGKVLGGATGGATGGAEQKARGAAQQQEQDAAKKAKDEAESKLKGLFGR
ncbi:MAG TPA: AsmA-like C-terminal region-containing protein [Myxococcales bacterium]|nr:AsmA-like C-terminal region-containing protein [Myxococcales bacterium]